MEYILEYENFLNEKESPVVRIVSVNSHGIIDMFIDKVEYEFYVNDFIIKKFKNILKHSSGKAVNYIRNAAGKNYKRLN